jgi:hypothetical protein
MRTPNEVREEILQHLGAHPGETKLNMLLTEHALACRQLALSTSATVMYLIADADPVDAAGWQRAAAWLRGTAPHADFIDRLMAGEDSE